MILTYKYRIKDRSARKVLAAHAYAVNQVWNWCVAQQRDIEDRYRAGAPKRNWRDFYYLAKQCNGVGKELGIHQQSVAAVCRQFCHSRDKNKRSPSFRSSNGSKRSLGWVPFEGQSRRTEGNSITYLGKRYRFWEGNRPLPETAKGGAFIEDASGKWFVCFNIEVLEYQTGANSQIGIDLGLKAIATCSDGYVLEAPRIYRKYEERLATAQRAGNKRRTKAIYTKIKNCRKDFIHKATTKIVRENALIAVGDVDSVKLAKTPMSKSVFDAGWSMFRSQLRYKCQQARAVYLDIDESFTTRTCSCCGAIPDSSPKGMGALRIRVWECSECGASHDRDVNAARNILRLALRVQRPVEGSQEPSNG
jgi:putative transposase